MVTVVRFVKEGVQKANDMASVSTLRPLLIMRLALNSLQDLHFIKSSLHVVRRALLNFDGNVGTIFEVFAEPYSREVSPSQFLNNYIATNEDLPDVDRMVPTQDVVVNALVFGIVILINAPQELFETVLADGGGLLAVIPLLESRIFTEII